jgi:hypothetical protein
MSTRPYRSSPVPWDGFERTGRTHSLHPTRAGRVVGGGEPRVETGLLLMVLAPYSRVRVSSGLLAPRESKIMLADPLFSEGFQLVDRNAPCKEMIGRVNRILKSGASVTKFRQGQCPGFVLVDWAPGRSTLHWDGSWSLGREGLVEASWCSIAGSGH